MELKDFILKLLKFKLLFVILVIFGGLSGFIFNSFQKPAYKAQISVYFVPTQQTFLSATSNEFTDTILGVLGSQNLGDGVSVTTRKIAPQIIEFTISAASRDKAIATAESLPANLSSALDNTLGANQVGLTQLTKEIKITEPANLLALNILVGALVGLAAGISIAATFIYFTL